MNKKNIAIVAAIALVVGAVAGGTAIYLLGDDEGTTTVATTSADTGTVDTGTGETVCPADVRKCVDGSFVGRAGPDCEFTPCPEPPPLQHAAPGGADKQSGYHLRRGAGLRGYGQLSRAG
jgi:hypothetical protein